MKFSLVILGAPYSRQASATALRFAKAAINKDHSIERVFFFDDGVYNSNALTVAPQDETNIPEEWSLLSTSHNIDMIACVSSALKRGIIDQTEAKRYEKEAANISEGTEISGLGQLVEATLLSDRVITFGS